MPIKRQSTDHAIRMILDQGERKDWGSGIDKKTEAKARTEARRISSLYGANTSSRIVKKRALRAAKGITSPPIRKNHTAMPLGRNRTAMFLLKSPGAKDTLKRSVSTTLAPTLKSGPSPSRLSSPSSSSGRRSRGKDNGTSSRLGSPSLTQVGARRTLKDDAALWTQHRVQIMTKERGFWPPRSSEYHPWYLGTDNVCHSPPGTQIYNRATRYGFRGSYNMAMHDNPEKYEEIPAHLSKISDLPPDVFLDPCFGAPSEWPYYNGRPLPPDPEIPKALLRSTRMEKEQFEDLKASIAHEQQLLNLKSAETMKLVRKRKQAIKRKKKRIMKGIDSSTFSPSHMRYWNDITMIYANRSKKVVAKDAAREKNDRGHRLTARWAQVKRFTEIMTLYRNGVPGLQDLNNLVKGFLDQTTENRSLELISRDQFIEAVRMLYPRFTEREANLLYSSFDLDREDGIDWRVFVCALRVFRRHNEPVKTKLMGCFDIMSDRVERTEGDMRQQGTILHQEVVPIFMLCVVSLEETLKMERIMERAFDDSNLVTASDLFGRGGAGSSAQDQWAVFASPKARRLAYGRYPDVTRADFEKILDERETLVNLFEDIFKKRLNENGIERKAKSFDFAF